MLRATMKAHSFLGCVLLTLFTTAETEKGILPSRACRNKNDCGDYGYACGQNQTCLCDMFYAVKNDKCVGGVGQKCRYDEHCIDGAFCEFQMRCQCKDDLYPSEDGLTCSRSKQTINHQPHLYTVLLFLIYLLKII